MVLDVVPNHDKLHWTQLTCLNITFTGEQNMIKKNIQVTLNCAHYNQSKVIWITVWVEKYSRFFHLLIITCLGGDMYSSSAFV